MKLLNATLKKASLPKVAFFVCGLCLPLKPAYACMPLNKPLDISMCVAGTAWELREDKGAPRFLTAFARALRLQPYEAHVISADAALVEPKICGAPLSKCCFLGLPA